MNAALLDIKNKMYQQKYSTMSYPCKKPSIYLLDRIPLWFYLFQLTHYFFVETV